MRTGPPLLLAALLSLLAVGGCTIPRWPVDGVLTSPFGIRWQGALPSVHRGVDISVPIGTPVHPMAPGRVMFAGEMSGFGLVVWLDHGGQVITAYAHLAEIRVETGAAVEGETVLGLSGESGNAQGPHLHFEVWRWGREVDPVPLLGGFPHPNE